MNRGGVNLAIRRQIALVIKKTLTKPIQI